MQVLFLWHYILRGPQTGGVRMACLIRRGKIYYEQYYNGKQLPYACDIGEELFEVSNLILGSQ